MQETFSSLGDCCLEVLKSASESEEEVQAAWSKFESVLEQVRTGLISQHKRSLQNNSENNEVSVLEEEKTQLKQQILKNRILIKKYEEVLRLMSA